jgi:hypothetical protein
MFCTFVTGSKELQVGGSKMSKVIHLLAVMLAVAGIVPFNVWAQCCSAPDNGGGTVDFPADCPYDHPDEPMMIISGVPPGTAIELAGPLTDFTNVVNTPGGSLGGERCTLDATLDLTATGTGELVGFNRHLSVAVSGVMHIGPRTPGDSIQSFPAKIDSLFGELFGDPDFCEFIVRAGDDYGHPSPGQTALTELPSGDSAVDSFFDITYEVEFEGCPGSQLEDYAGITTDTVRRMLCYEFAGVPEVPSGPRLPSRLSLAPGRPNPFTSFTTIKYAIPAGSDNRRASIKIYDIMGRQVTVLVDGALPAGIHHVEWNGRDQAGKAVAPGVYFCRLTTDRKAVSQRIVLLR